MDSPVVIEQDETIGNKMQNSILTSFQVRMKQIVGSIPLP